MRRINQLAAAVNNDLIGSNPLCWDDENQRHGVAGVDYYRAAQFTVDKSQPISKYTQHLGYRNSLDISDGKLELRYDYGEPDIIPITVVMMKGFDNRFPGGCWDKGSYQSMEANFSVNFLPQQLPGIIISQIPERIDYAPGMIFDLDVGQTKSEPEPQ